MNSPYKGKFRVSQQYKGSAHDGLDLVGIDSKNIYSTVDGVVEYAGWESAVNHKKGFGQYVRIKQNGTSDRYYFGHLSEIKVKVGDTVEFGDVIGIEGNTGKSTGSHCHYCVRTDASRYKIKNISTISGIPNELGAYFDNSKSQSKKDVYYCVRSGGRWLSEVKNLEDYAGIIGKPITEVAIKIPNETIRYRVHTYGGKWLPYVSGYDKNDFNNGYAGNGTPIDAIEIIFVKEGRKVFYRVSPLKSSYYSWQESNIKNKDMDGYAGLFGKKIDRLQIEVK